MDFEGSPPPFGSSHMTGAVLRGQAYGNVLNHADFPKLGSGGVPLTNYARQILHSFPKLCSMFLLFLLLSLQLF